MRKRRHLATVRMQSAKPANLLDLALRVQRTPWSMRTLLSVRCSHASLRCDAILATQLVFRRAPTQILGLTSQVRDCSFARATADGESEDQPEDTRRLS